MQITRSVVHDLRNFLNAFSIALQLISRAPSKAESGLALATRQAADMKQLVDDMVEYSVVLGDSTPLAVEPFDLRELFDELVTACRPPIEAKGLRLSARFDANVTTVLSNRIKVKQVALNLLSNATKYTKTGEIELAMGGYGESSWYRAAGDDIPGVGLGLAIVKELCRVLDGRIRFETREGLGTTFDILFLLRHEASQDSNH
jgi:signal transduction histidine kinase